MSLHDCLWKLLETARMAEPKNKKKCERIAFLALSLHGKALGAGEVRELMNHCAGLWLVSLKIMADDEFP